MGTSHIHMFSGLVPSLNANGRALHRGQAYQAVVGEDDDLLSFESANNLRDSGAPTIESSQNTPAPRVEPAPAPSGAVTAADPTRDQASLFLDVCGALEPSENPEANEILTELRTALSRAQGELHSRITMVEDESQIVELFNLNEVLEAAFAAYQAAVERYNTYSATPPSSVEPVAPSDNDLMDLLGGPGPTSDGLETVPAAGSSDPAQAPQSLVRTSSAEAFEQFFGARSNVDDVFASPVTPGTPIKAV